MGKLLKEAKIDQLPPAEKQQLAQECKNCMECFEFGKLMKTEVAKIRMGQYHGVNTIESVQYFTMGNGETSIKTSCGVTRCAFEGTRLGFSGDSEEREHVTEVGRFSLESG